MKHVTTSAQIVYELNLVGHIFKFRPVAIFVSLDLETAPRIVYRHFSDLWSDQISAIWLQCLICYCQNNELNLVGHIFKFRSVAIFVSLDLETVPRIVCRHFSDLWSDRISAIWLQYLVSYWHNNELSLVGHIFKFRPVAIFVSLVLQTVPRILCRHFSDLWSDQISAKWLQCLVSYCHKSER
jgi:hypothetical protein